MALAAMVAVVVAVGESVPVRVVDATGRAVEAARVAWQAPFAEEDWGFEERMKAALPLGAALERVLAPSARTVLTDAEGQAEIGDWIWVVAAAEIDGTPSFAAATLHSVVCPLEPIRLVLQPERVLDVRVLDATGAPVPDAPVVLWCNKLPGSAPGWSAVTDARGHARFTPIDLLAVAPAWWVPPPARAEWQVALVGPFEPWISGDFDPGEPPSTPLELQLPPCGQLVVDLVAGDGHPLPGGGTIEVAPSSPQRMPKRVVSPATTHVVPHVPVGCEWVVTVLGTTGRRVELKGQGPAVAGEVVRVAARFGPLAPSEALTARLLDGIGLPLADRDIVLLERRQGDPDERERVAPARSDAEGRVAFFLPPRSTAGERCFDLVELDPAFDGGIRAAAVHLEAPKSADEEVARLALGDVTLTETVAVLRGVVVDERDRPVVGALVNGNWCRPAWQSARMGIGRRPQPDPLLRSRTSDDGSFTWWDLADARGAPLIWTIESADGSARQLQQQSDFAVESTAPRRVVYRRAGRIRGRLAGAAATTVQGSDPRGSSELTVALDWDEGTRRWELAPGSGMHRDGCFSADVPNGVVDFTVWRGPELLVTIPGIDVPPDGVVDLGTFDLDCLERTITLAIVDETGQPIERGWFVAVDAVAEAQRLTHGNRGGSRPLGPMRPADRLDVHWFERGRLDWRPPRLPPELAVGAPGRDAVIVRSPAAEQLVVLGSAPVVTLNVDWEGARLPEPFVLLADAGPVVEDRDWLRFGPRASGDDPERRLPPLEAIKLRRGEPVALPLRCSGPHVVEIALALPLFGDRILKTGRFHHTSELTIAPGGSPQSFTLRLDGAALAAAVAGR